MLYHYTAMVTGSHIYALHMSIADLFLILMLPFKIMSIHNHDTWQFGSGVCKLFKTITIMNFLVSITFLTLMAYDRNRAIQGNYRPSRRKGAPKSVHIIAALVWITGFAFATPTFVKSTVKSLELP